MRRLTTMPPSSPPADFGERVRWIAQASNEIADVLLHCDPAQVDTKLNAIYLKYAQAMGVKTKDVAAATATARKKLIDLAKPWRFAFGQVFAAARLLQDPGSPAGSKQAAQDAGGSFNGLELQATTVLPAAGTLAACAQRQGL